MSSHVRQRKSPYFYVRKGTGFVLLDNHEETQTRYKSEAEAKKAVLSLNNAWRAKHGSRGALAKSNPRRRNPAGGQRAARDEVLHLFSTASVGAGRELDAFADRLGRGEALSALDIEDAVTAAEARLEDAEYEVKANRIAEYRAGLREERDHYHMLLKAIKKLQPAHTRNPRKYDESKDGEGFHKLSDLKKGEYFKRKPDARSVYQKGDYDRSVKKYECESAQAYRSFGSGIGNPIYLKGDTLVYVGFTY